MDWVNHREINTEHTRTPRYVQEEEREKDRKTPPKHNAETHTFLKPDTTIGDMKKEEVETSSSNFPGEISNTDQAVTQHAIPDSFDCAPQA